MTRTEYLQDQKNRLGRRVMGVFPAQYPREILWAFNVLPVEIWDPPLETASADAHLQPYICSVVKLGLELILRGRAEGLDALLFPHTCDSIQNLASLVGDYLDLEVPALFFYHPKAPYTDPARSYYRRRLEGLIADLERLFGPLDPTRLNEAVDQGQALYDLLGRLYARRAEGRLALTNREFYDLIRRAEWLHPDDLIPQLEAALARPEAEPGSIRPVVLSGVLPNPAGVLDLLDELGLPVGHDDFLACSRRWLGRPSSATDPLDRLTEVYFSLPPCSTKGGLVDERLTWLTGLAQGCRAGGVLFLMVKFCEPELFDVPHLTAGLTQAGLQTMTVDVQVGEGLSGRLTTRIEAFVEMPGAE